MCKCRVICNVGQQSYVPAREAVDNRNEQECSGVVS